MNDYRIVRNPKWKDEDEAEYLLFGIGDYIIEMSDDLDYLRSEQAVWLVSGKEQPCV